MNHIKILRDALEERCGRNTRYSLRAFARDLKVSAPRLSRWMNGFEGLSVESAVKIAQQLNMTSVEAENFIVSVEAHFGRSKETRRSAQEKLAQKQMETPFPDLRGRFQCPPSATKGINLILEISQFMRSHGEIIYTYNYIYPETTSTVEYAAYPVGSALRTQRHLYYSNRVLFCDSLSETSTNYYYVDAKTKNYVAGRVGDNPIICERL